MSATIAEIKAAWLDFTLDDEEDVITGSPNELMFQRAEQLLKLKDKDDFAFGNDGSIGIVFGYMGDWTKALDYIDLFPDGRISHYHRDPSENDEIKGAHWQIVIPADVAETYLAEWTP